MSKLAIQLIKQCIDDQGTYLDIGRCGLRDGNIDFGSEIDRLLRQCWNLRTLILSNEWQEDSYTITSRNFENYNHFNIYPPAIEKLQKLENIICCGDEKNKWGITEIEFAKNLKCLRRLDIAYNKVQSISSLVPLLKENLFFKLSAKGNPLDVPPIEVIEQGNDAILRYFNKIEIEGEEQVYEAKLVLTGSGESGKTSLSWRLNNKNCILPRGDERTKEVEVTNYYFKTNSGKDFTAYVWDFGGQQVIHNFHRLFMNDSALYILLTETSRENDDFDYWLQTIQLFGGNSPILFVQNKRNGVPRRLGIVHYKNHFNIKDDLFEINLLNNEGLPNLEKAIQRYIQELPIVQRTIPKSWFWVRKKLSQISLPFISYNEFAEICDECNIEKTLDIEDVGVFLHLLGIVLWYKDNPALRDKIILDRHWATKALFQLVFSDKIDQAQKGYFTKADAQEIWDNDLEAEYRHHTAQLIALMQEFKLAYSQRNKRYAYIIPALLPSIRPNRDFTEEKRLTVIFQYVFMPRGIVNQLTAELFEKIENDEDTWSEGVWLKEGNTEARVMENRNERAILVEVAGIQYRELFGIIKNTLDNIHSEYKGVKYEMKIPCICTSCKVSDIKHYYNYQTIILRLEARKKDTIECELSTYDVSLNALLDNVLPPKIVGEIERLHRSMEMQFNQLHSANQQTHSYLDIIKSDLSLQNEIILELLTLGEDSKNKLDDLLGKVDYQYSNEKASDLLQRIDEAITDNLEALPGKIAEEWQKLSTKSNSAAETKAKLKFKLPIIPYILDYEGELSVDMKKMRKKLQSLVF